MNKVVVVITIIIVFPILTIQEKTIATNPMGQKQNKQLTVDKLVQDAGRLGITVGSC